MTLLEAAFAAAILLVGVGAGSQLLLVSTQANQGARVTTLASMLARGKMEQLRGLEGAGLVPSPPGSLDRNTDGYCDYLDVAGRLLGAGTFPPPDGTVFIRRWSVEPLAASPDSAIVLQVLVTTRGDRGVILRPGSPGGAHFVSLKTRNAG